MAMEAIAVTQSLRITMSVEETMAAMSIGRTMLYELLGNGSIESIKVGKKRLIIAASLLSFVADMKSYEIDALVR